MAFPQDATPAEEKELEDAVTKGGEAVVSFFRKRGKLRYENDLKEILKRYDKRNLQDLSPRNRQALDASWVTKLENALTNKEIPQSQMPRFTAITYFLNNGKKLDFVQTEAEKLRSTEKWKILGGILLTLLGIFTLGVASAAIVVGVASAVTPAAVLSPFFITLAKFSADAFAASVVYVLAEALLLLVSKRNRRMSAGFIMSSLSFAAIGGGISAELGVTKVALTSSTGLGKAVFGNSTVVSASTVTQAGCIMAANSFSVFASLRMLRTGVPLLFNACVDAYYKPKNAKALGDAAFDASQINMSTLPIKPLTPR